MNIVPLAAFVINLFLGFLRYLGRRYRDQGWGDSLYWLTGGDKPGRTTAEERILFWHRGFAISDVMLGAHVLDSAASGDVGTVLNLFDLPDE